MTPSEPAGGSAPRPGTRRQTPDPSADSRQLWAAADSGWVMMVELLTAVFTWGGIGWLFDRWLGTAPWLMVTGFVVGWGAGIYLVWVRSNRAEQARTAAASERDVAADERPTTEGTPGAHG